MPRLTVGLSRKPALVLTSSECSGAGKPIAVAAGSGYIQRHAIPKTTLAGFFFALLATFFFRDVSIDLWEVDVLRAMARS